MVESPNRADQHANFEIKLPKVPACVAGTVDEWCAIAEAGNGSTQILEGGLMHALQLLRTGLHDSAHRLNDKWNVDCDTLAWSLVSMSPGEQLAVYELVRGFWQVQPYENETHAQFFTRLGAPGLM